MFCTIIAVIICGFRYFYATNEDAWIVYKYVRNLVNGFGLVSNPGGDHEEGYSDLLWVLLLAIAKKFANVDIVIASKILGITSLVILTLLCRSILQRAYTIIGLDSLFVYDVILPMLLMIAVGCSTFACYWAAQGLETSFYSMQIVLLVYFFFRLLRTPEAKYVYILASVSWMSWLTRPEGAMNFFVVFAFVILYAVLERKIGRQLAAHIGASIGVILIITAVFLFWKFKYFGDIIANPTYVKLGVRRYGQFAPYALGYLKTKGIVFSAALGLSMAVGLIYCFSHLLRRKNSELALLMLLIVTLIGSQIFFVWQVRNDYMEYWRFWMTHYPLAVLLVLLTAPLLLPKTKVWMSVVSVCIGLMMVYSAFSEPAFGGTWWATGYTHPGHDLDNSHYGKVARRLSALMAANPNAKYALSEYGYIPFHADGFGIDMLALNSRRLARNFKYYPFDEVFYASRDAVLVELPKVIIAGGVYRIAPTVDNIAAFPELAVCDGSGCRTQDLLAIPATAWFFKPYLESAFFRKYYSLNPPANQSTWDWTFFELRSTPNITSALSANDRDHWDQLLHGFREENGVLLASSISRAMLKPEVNNNEVCIEGSLLAPTEKSTIELRSDEDAIGDHIAAVKEVNRGDFKICAPLSSYAKEKPILVTVRTSDPNASFKVRRFYCTSTLTKIVSHK